MPTFSEAFQDLCAGLADLPGSAFGERVEGFLNALKNSTPEELSWAAGPLVSMVARVSQPNPAALGILGELFCRGLNFWGYLPNYLAAMGRTLERAHAVDQAVRPLLPSGKFFNDLELEAAMALLDRLPAAIKDDAPQWFRLDFSLAPALALLQQFRGGRQLARTIGFPVDWLADQCLGTRWLDQMPKLFEADEGPLPDFGPASEAALTSLRQASKQPPRNAEAIQQLLSPIFEATTYVTPQQFDRVAAELAQLASEADPQWAGELAGVCGAFCERGANPEAGIDALIAGLPRLLDPVASFVEACRALPVGDDESAVEVHGDTVGQRMPEARRALNALGSYCLGTIAHLARSGAARLRHGQRTDLLTKLDFVRWDTGNTGFLWKMLQVLDEELVILAPAFQLGWRVKIGGVADNFQLHALLAGYLVGQVDDGKYPGKVGTMDQPEPGPGVPLSSRTIATQLNAPCTGQEPGLFSSIQLWNWTGLLPDGTLPPVPTDAHEHWVWNEGVPADIATFDGTRVVLLGPTNLHRSWNGGRMFPFMEASFQILEMMSPETARDWLQRIAARAEDA